MSDDEIEELETLLEGVRKGVRHNTHIAYDIEEVTIPKADGTHMRVATFAFQNEAEAHVKMTNAMPKLLKCIKGLQRENYDLKEGEA